MKTQKKKKSTENRKQNGKKMPRIKQSICTGTLYRKHVEAVNLAEQMANGKWLIGLSIL